MTLPTALPTGFMILAVRPAADVAGFLPDGSASPDDRAVLVGSNAQAWDAFVADLTEDPARLTGEAHPFDAWVRRALGRGGIPPQRPPGGAWWPCDAHATLNFLGIARAMGLPGPSPIGLGIHPTWGPWWGIRGLAIGAFPELADTPDLVAPCAACIAAHGRPPCAAACPAHVIRPDGAGAWRLDGPACARVHLDADTCTHGCAARDACPVGQAHRYPDDAVRYHANRAAGRVALRRTLGIADADDPYTGIGPPWAAWAGTR